MHIHGLGSVPNPLSTPSNPSSQPVENKPPEEIPRPEDRVEISSTNQAADRDTAPGVRELRLARIKAAIEAGEYETEDKLDAALSRLFGELGLGDDEED